MNYKIKVDGNIEELTSLFIALGCKYFNHTVSEKNYMIVEDGKGFFCKLKSNFKKSECREISIDQLKDMVVLKRNDVSDATHTDGHYSFYVGKDKNYFFSSCDKAWRGTWKNVEILKPIEKPMKEYLNKLEDGTYKIVLLDSVADSVEGLIEIPEGSMFATGSDVIFRRNNYIFDDGAWELTDVTIDNANFYGLNITWQRETLNDKVASAEVARQDFIRDLPELNFEAVGVAYGVGFDQDNVNQPSHYNKGGVECIDAIQSSMTHEAFCGYLKGNIQKYIFRYEDKGGLESLLKAQWYLNKMIGIIECSKVKNSED